ncbi:amino acid-binding protein [Micropruina sonneratiae]|uniref:amino acid-binding protein n=1 Tax=Micropruina sonneratiae TaxID=2986940 RepID=UPI0022267E07|nr:amino acid-binding protein [Micropruina sp. KQZ13P-5]MCW3157575.1 amino acid-binding protein [Micropruina sp. KQZ13P-5]
MFLLRVALPDRPGSLGAVATAMGTVGADIQAVEIVEKYEGFAVDDFMVEVPLGTLPDALITSCTSIAGVTVLWFSHYPEGWGLQADVAVLDKMTENPQESATILTQAAPTVFRVHWAAQVDRADGRVVARTPMAPDAETLPVAALGRLDTARSIELADEWLPGWPEMLVAAAPFRDGTALLLARKGGPAFIKSELARLRHLTSLSG